MTKRLYERDAYCREFTATVVSCEQDGEVYRVVLDQTAFFPEGGGQAADEGTLNGEAVQDVQLKDGEVVHTVSAPLAVGSTVHGCLNWPLRFERMQSHAGEHIVSGVVHRLFGYDNVGFHMSEALMTVDFNGPLSAEDLETVEREANAAVWQNAAITVSFPTPEEQATLTYRSKLENIDDLRLVTMEGIDCCACCAPHPARTGEIGLVKIVDSMPYKGGTRITMLAGKHALADYAALNRVNKSLMKLLSAPREAVAEAVNRHVEAEQTLRAENQQLLKRVALGELKPIAVNGSVMAATADIGFDEMRYCANTLMENDTKACVLLSAVGEGYLYVAAGDAAVVKAVVTLLNTQFGGKGGGKPNYAQGKVPSKSAEELLAAVEALL